MSNCCFPPGPVALTGKRTGMQIRQPTMHETTEILRSRRKRKPSSDEVLRICVSEVAMKVVNQLRRPFGRGFARSL